MSSQTGVPADIPQRRNSPSIGHRSSFADNLRSSPRGQRHPSFSQLALHDLITSPPIPKTIDPRFSGRDWRTIHVAELVNQDDLHWAELDADFETCTKALIDADSSNVILVRQNPADRTACDTFDYTDLNAYLLVILGLAQPDDDQVDLFRSLARKSQEHTPVPLREVLGLAKKSPLVALPDNADLAKAIELFGGGCHRILVCKQQTDNVIGILSQSKVLRFMWENGANFPVIHQLYSCQVKELHLGNHAAISINGDKPLEEALQLMATKGLTSIAVVDNALNVVGNISTADTRLLTRASSIPLLKNTCMHFISVILTERGIQNGQDSFPVFHLSTSNTLSQAVSKLIATRSHRLWTVEPPSPSPSVPATPTGTYAMLSSQVSSSPASPNFPSVPAASLPGANISGKLTGVVSLTDILNMFAKRSGLHPLDPNDQRSRRRRSSSSSVRPSLDMGRSPGHDTSETARSYRHTPKDE